MFQPSKLSLKCFSPPVMLATFAIELIGALWVLWKYRMTIESRLIAAILFSLAVFQAAEFMVCEGAFGVSSVDWARVGYVAISFLPALGMHLAVAITGRNSKMLIGLGYGVATVFSAYFLTVGHGITGSQCLGNYVIFSVSQETLHLYAAYYYSWLIAGMMYAYMMGRRLKDTHKKKALIGLSVGYFSFVVPTTLVNIIEPSSIAGIPSIMCGFAVFLALILLFWVAPAVCVERRPGDVSSSRRSNTAT